MKHFFMINSTFGMGGPARVMSSWANFIVSEMRCAVSLISEDDKDFFFKTNDKVFQLNFGNENIRKNLTQNFFVFI